MYAVASSRPGKRAIRLGRWKLVVGKNKGWLRLFDLERDPDEQRDVAEEAPVAGRLCDIHLGEALASPSKTTRLQGSGATRVLRARNTEVDGELRRQLEALGYL
jgi:arylsulfatase A-like enzyme